MRANSHAGRRPLLCKLKDETAAKCNADEGVAASVMLPDRNSFPGWPRMQSEFTFDCNELRGYALKSLLWEGKDDRRGSDLLQVSQWVGVMTCASVLFVLERAGIGNGSVSMLKSSWECFEDGGKAQRGQGMCSRLPSQDSGRAGNKTKSPGVPSCHLCFYCVWELQAKR